MSKLINSDAQLRAHLPNVISSVKGETPLIEKLAVLLDLAEEWVCNTFTSESTFNAICGYDDSNATKCITARLVVADALIHALPSLDVVLTPNGFGVVSTQNLTPASTARVERLATSLQEQRGECIAALLPALVGTADWLASKQAEFFGSTLFPDLGIVDAVGRTSGSKWERYLQLRPQLIDLEATLAEEWLSPELMSVFRSENLSGTLTEPHQVVVRQVKAQIVGYFKTGSFSSRRLADIVNYIRVNGGDFKEWHESKTAELFAPPVFRNRKEAHGYFF